MKLLKILLCALLFVSLVGCSANEKTTTVEINDGTYEVTVDGRNDKMTVATTIKGGKITAVEVKDNAETKGVADGAIENVPARIVENNSVNVDTETGATVTSEAIITAVKEAITTAGGKVEDFSNIVSKGEVKEETIEADVVVVGAGAAGVTAALAAQQAGAKTILLEKSAAAGGVSIIAGGPMAIDSKLQQEAGVAGTFTIADVVKSWQDYNCWFCDGTLFYNLFKDSGKTIDWLGENGMEFVYVGNEQAAHADGYPTYHAYADQSNKMQYYTNVVENFTSNGGTVYYNTPAVELLSDGTNVTGVKANGNGVNYTVNCKSVVLATGGFGANAEAIEKAVGFPLETFTTGTQTGDGASMSQAIGADVGKTIQQYHGVTSYSGIQTGSGMDELARVIYTATSVWVNKTGSRFAPEDLNYDTALASNSAASQGEYFFSIVDQNMIDTFASQGAKGLGIDVDVCYEPFVPLFPINDPWTDYQKVMDDAVEKGIAFKGDTIEELADKMGVSASTLKATIDQYNLCCENGVDSIFQKDAKYLTAVNNGPYYAVKARPVSLGGIGGVKVNSNLEVIRPDGSVIGGLYAAGNDIAEQYNNTYPLVEGVSLGTAFCSGKICGDSAAAFAAK